MYVSLTSSVLLNRCHLGRQCQRDCRCRGNLPAPLHHCTGQVRSVLLKIVNASAACPVLISRP